MSRKPRLTAAAEAQAVADSYRRFLREPLSDTSEVEGPPTEFDAETDHYDVLLGKRIGSGIRVAFLCLLLPFIWAYWIILYLPVVGKFFVDVLLPVAFYASFGLVCFGIARIFLFP